MVKILGKTYGEIRETIQRKLGADHIKLKEADSGRIDTEYAWTDRIPHPNNMGNYEQWSKDPEASIALALACWLHRSSNPIETDRLDVSW